MECRLLSALWNFTNIYKYIGTIFCKYNDVFTVADNHENVMSFYENLNLKDALYHCVSIYIYVFNKLYSMGTYVRYTYGRCPH